MPAEPTPAEMRAVARLPGLDLTIEHSPSDGESPEELRITLRAPPGAAGGPGAFAPVLMGLANPMLAWMALAQAMWAPWAGLLEAAMRWPMLPPGGGGAR